MFWAVKTEFKKACTIQCGKNYEGQLAYDCVGVLSQIIFAYKESHARKTERGLFGNNN
jgi:hypothetical protein